MKRYLILGVFALMLAALFWIMVPLKDHTQQAVQFLDNEFHILQPQNKVIESEDLQFVSRHKKYTDSDVTTEHWHGYDEKYSYFDKDYYFEENRVSDFYFNFYKDNNYKKIRIKVLKYLDNVPYSPLNKTDGVWDLENDKVKIQVTLRETYQNADPENWEGNMLWKDITYFP